MKRMTVLIFLIFALSGINKVKSQDPAVREDINLINSLLKENPYKDPFMEITFYYSVDITADNELVVNMDFNGPFKTIVKARIMDLDSSLQIDTALEGTSSVCWFCKSDGKEEKASCVCNESITTDGEKESHYNDSICVMISRKAEIRDELIKAFSRLFKKFLEQ